MLIVDQLLLVSYQSGGDRDWQNRLNGPARFSGHLSENILHKPNQKVQAPIFLLFFFIVIIIFLDIINVVIHHHTTSGIRPGFVESAFLYESKANSWLKCLQNHFRVNTYAKFDLEGENRIVRATATELEESGCDRVVRIDERILV